MVLVEGGRSRAVAFSESIGCADDDAAATEYDADSVGASKRSKASCESRRMSNCRRVDQRQSTNRDGFEQHVLVMDQHCSFVRGKVDIESAWMREQQ